MDEDANLLIDPQELFHQHHKLDVDLSILIEKFERGEMEKRAQDEEREHLRVILNSLVPKGAQEELLKSRAEGLDDPEV